jgi:hypothetical protein
MTGRIAGLLTQFSNGTDQRVFTHIQLAGWELQKATVQGVAPLTLEQQVTIVEDRNNGRGAGMQGVLANTLGAIGGSGGVALNLEQDALEDRVATEATLGQMRGWLR